MQDYISAIAVIGLLWLVVKLAFGGTQGATQAGSNGGRGIAGGPGASKESAAAQAWRESKDERQRQLNKRKLEMIEAARRKILEQKQSSEHQSERLPVVGDKPSSSSTILT